MRKGGGRPAMRAFAGRRRPGRQERAEVHRAPAEGRAGANLRTGELRLHRDGYGFVIAPRPGPATEASAGKEEDLFIPARFVGDAMHTDIVEARVLPGRKGKLEGRIARIVKRNVASLMGRIERHGKVFQVIADDRRVRHRIAVPADKFGGARHNDNVVVRILKYPSGATPAVGEVMEVLGPRGEEATEKAAVIARHQLAREFSSAAQREADAAFRLVDEAVIARRRDLRDIPFVTIDGENAKDFDDAVAAERLEGGLIRLWVSIADVSYFVRPSTVLDKSAYERGTSVYFPGDCLPMLPEQLSNVLCSLRPNEDRLTVTAEMDVNPQGGIVRRDFYRSVIQSRERMTYTAVKKMLVDRDAVVRDRYRKLVPQFDLMVECFKRLRARRTGRGAIDFDLPEPEIVIDMQGDVADIVRAERHIGHMMIEDFMIAANESVAEFLEERGLGCIYRIHEPPPPDKLSEFSILLHNLGIRFRAGGGVPPGALARVVEAIRGRPEERLVNHMLLRSMAQAVYSPANKGHFGLASKCYCHFTSPIRRYPDLVVHRLLTHALEQHGGTRGRGDERTKAISSLDTVALGATIRSLQEIAEHCSRRERIAMEAERETAKLCAALFMQGKVGEVFEGIISHAAKFGFFVELIDYFVEGLVHIDTLLDDRYHLEETGMVIRGRKGRRAYRIGDRVRVEVAEVDVPARDIFFRLA